MSLDDFIVIDTETIPSQNLPESCMPQFDESEVKLGNLVDRWKIEQKINDAREKWQANLDKDMATDPYLCQICCLVGYHKASDEFLTLFAPDQDSEFDMLNTAWEWIGKHYRNRIPLVGYNSSSFDLPVMLTRSMLLDVTVQPGMIGNFMKRQDYGNRYHYDLMQRLGHRNPFSGKLEYKKLDYHLQRFRIGGKPTGWNGSQVYPAFKEVDTRTSSITAGTGMSDRRRCCSSGSGRG